MRGSLAAIAVDQALRRLPVPLLQILLQTAAETMARRHQSLFERLGPFAGMIFVFKPQGNDRPLLLRLSAPPLAPLLRLARPADLERADAILSGRLEVLLDLLEGKLDGDAVFFSRDLVVSGNTEAILALRNAVDGEEIDLVGDLFAQFGPFAPPARQIVGLAAQMARRATTDLEGLREWCLAPALARCEETQAMVRELRSDLAKLQGTRAHGPSLVGRK